MYNIISTIENYPEDGKHQQCDTGLPFCIRKGEDGYYYNVKGIEKKYNIFKGDKIDDRWICHLTESANESLEQIFQIKCNKDLDSILEYCKKTYIKSLKLEIKRMTTEIKSLEHVAHGGGS